MILLDTNVLVYALDTSSPHHVQSRGVVERIQQGSLDGAIVPQVLLETYAIVTDGRRVARPLSPADALQELGVLQRSFVAFYPTADAMRELAVLVAQHPVIGQDVFDAFLVAQMHEHGIDTICTLNIGDFAVFHDLKVVTPADLL